MDLPAPPIPDSAGISLFLDFDGTLVDLAATPHGVSVGEDLGALLGRLAAVLPGRVAIVSGRSIEQLDQLLGGYLDGIAIAGSHGSERRTTDEGHVAPERTPALDRAVADLGGFMDDRGLLLEPKTLGVTLHYRSDPDREAETVAMAETVAARHGLHVNRGKMMVEVRLPGDKGGAVRTLLASPAMAGTTPWFLGDDVTDEDGFGAAADLGGAGILVDPPRATKARYRLDDVPAVHAWLSALADTAA